MEHPPPLVRTACTDASGYGGDAPRLASLHPPFEALGLLYCRCRRPSYGGTIKFNELYLLLLSAGREWKIVVCRVCSAAGEVYLRICVYLLQ